MDDVEAKLAASSHSALVEARKEVAAQRRVWQDKEEKAERAMNATRQLQQDKQGQAI